MSSNRLLYDKCAYDQELRQLNSQLTYTLDSAPFKHCNECRMEYGTQGGNTVSHPPSGVNMVELENELRGMRYPLSHCPKKKFLPTADGKLPDKRDYKCDDEKMFLDLSGKKNHLNGCQLFDLHDVQREYLVPQMGCPLDSADK
jgi:hypothetical protein